MAEAVAVEISSQVREIINRNNIQIRSLAGLPEGVIDPFLARRQEAVLLFKGRPTRVLFLSRIDDETFEVQAPDLVPYLRNSAVVLVVLPGAGRRYVIQAAVVRVFAEKVRLRCLDPRFSTRIVPSEEVVFSWRLVPDEVEMAIKDDGLKVFRDAGKGIIEKVAPENDQRQPPGFEAGRNFAVLADISSGGCGLLSRARIDPGIENHLLYLENDESSPCRIGIFAVARMVAVENSGGRVHLMFIARLDPGVVKKVAGI